MTLIDELLVADIDDFDFDDIASIVKKELSDYYNKHCIKLNNDCYYDYIVFCSAMCEACHISFKMSQKIFKILLDLKLISVTTNCGDELYAI